VTLTAQKPGTRDEVSRRRWLILAVGAVIAAILFRPEARAKEPASVPALAQ
jgi:hypothetical protein